MRAHHRINENVHTLVFRATKSKVKLINIESKRREEEVRHLIYHFSSSMLGIQWGRSPMKRAVASSATPTALSRRKATKIKWVTLLTAVGVLGSLWFQIGLSSYYYNTYDGTYTEINQQLFNGFNYSDKFSVKPSPRRSLVLRDEFMFNRMSEESLSSYFAFDPLVSTDALTGSFDPVFKCSEFSELQGSRNSSGVANDATTSSSAPRKKNKIIFVQVTPDSPVRTLLSGYADYCHAAIAVVSNCPGLGIEYMQADDPWYNGKGSPQFGEPCFLSYALNQSGHEIEGVTGYFNNYTNKISTSFLEKNRIDILAGNVPLGSDAYWKEEEAENDDHVRTQYVAFFHDPLRNFVDEFIIQNQPLNLPVDEALALIQSNVSNERAAGRYHEKYSKYFITPEQKYWAASEGVQWTFDRRVNLTLQNIVNMQVLVGIVERMPGSLQLLEHLLDEEHEVQGLFEFFSSSENLNKVGFKARNVTDAVVKAIRNDDSLLTLLEDFLKFEIRIFNFAKQVHEQQFQFLVKQRKNQTSPRLE